MLIIACSACQKKLSVKEDLVGKKVKCPGCGTLTVVPAQVGAPNVGFDEMRTVPPAPGLDVPAPAPSQGDADSPPTHPPSEKPDVTQGLKPDPEHDSGLTDFLAPPQSNDELGRLGDFRILKILGHGGMGVVFLGEDSTLDRLVAIKAMLPGMAASASAGKRFLREAKTTAKVEHDHIVPIFHVGMDRGAPYIVMPFLKGEPLDQRLKRDEKIPLTEMLRIGREMAKGLHAAHATGLIHRDIKPANIWLEGPEARVKILDFGLARAAAQESGLTQQGAIIGTPAYMAPEQGRGAEVDARCDLFSLGVVLYRMCTGQAPFHGTDTVSTLMSVAMHDPAPPAKINVEVPEELSDLVMKLLEKDRDKRVGTAAEVVKALQEIEESVRKKESREPTIAMAVPVTSKPSLDRVLFRVDDSLPPPKEVTLPSPQASAASLRGTPPKRRTPLALATGAVALLALLAGAIYYWQTNNGIVRIEINDPDIKVAFDKNGPTISGVDKHDIKLTPGEFGLTVERGDLKFDTDKFVLKRGETITLKIEWFKDGKLQVVQGDRIIGEKKVPPVPIAAAWALQFDGKKDSVVVPSLTLGGESAATFEGYVNLISGPDDFNSCIMGVPNLLYLSFSPHAFQRTWTLTASRGATILFAYDTVEKGHLKVEKGKTVHLAVVRDKKRFRIFVDGKLRASQDFALSESKGSFALGQRIPVAIHEVRVSKVARYDKDFTPAKRFEPDADTLALYHFDEGSGDVLKDSSGNGHHGKIVGAKWVNADGTPIATPTPDAGSSARYALLLEGPARVNLPDSLKVDAAAPYTLEAYVTVKSRSETGNTVLQSEGHSKLLLQSKDGKLNLVGRCGNSQAISNEPFALGEEKHLAMVISGQEIRLFMDGKLVRSTKENDKIKITVGKNEKSFQIGSQYPRPALNGVIHELRISRTARYEREFTPQKRFEPDADTLALYHCDEGTGDVLKDSSGNGHHGKIVGAKWVNADGSPISSFPPLDPAWLKAVAAMKPQEQVEAVKAELMKRNPEFDGTVTPRIDKNGNVSDLTFWTDEVTDIAPVWALAGLRHLNCAGSSAGKGKLADLSRLKGLKLYMLSCGFTQITDLSPLKDMKLTALHCAGTNVSDLLPLRDMPLTELSCPFVAERDAEILRSIKTLKKINGKAAAAFWKEVDGKAAPTTFPRLNDAWLKQVAAMKPQQQVEAVKAELMKRNPEFDGTLKPVIDKDGVVTELTLSTEFVSDIFPIKALTGLKRLTCNGHPDAFKRGQLKDLTPLQGMQLTRLSLTRNPVMDLKPLQGMPLTSLALSATKVVDLRPLATLEHLTDLDLVSAGASDLSPLAEAPLVALSASSKVIEANKGVPSIKALKTINGKAAAAFWKEVDQKKP